jgi:hypothetical protein
MYCMSMQLSLLLKGFHFFQGRRIQGQREHTAGTGGSGGGEDYRFVVVHILQQGIYTSGPEAVAGSQSAHHLDCIGLEMLCLLSFSSVHDIFYGKGENHQPVLTEVAE